MCKWNIVYDEYSRNMEDGGKNKWKSVNKNKKWTNLFEVIQLRLPSVAVGEWRFGLLS